MADSLGITRDTQRAELHKIVRSSAAEVIYDRANAEKEHMGLTSWKGSPHGKIHRYDVLLANNYLTDDELTQMEYLVSVYLDLAELQALRHIPITMQDWEERLNALLRLWDREVLQDAGRVSAEIAKTHAQSEFEKYRIVQDHLYQSDFDHFMQLEEAGRCAGEGEDNEQNQRPD